MSIVDPKYREAAKGKTKDWLASALDTHATKMKEVTKKVAVEGSDPPKFTETKEQKPDGVDVDKLFVIAKMNNVAADKIATYEAQRENHGFAGRLRMTLSNILRRMAKERHGLYFPGAKGAPEWTSAPKDFLENLSAGEAPTHQKDGTKIVVAKPAPAAKEDAKPAAAAPAKDAAK